MCTVEGSVRTVGGGDLGGGSTAGEVVGAAPKPVRLPLRLFLFFLRLFLHLRVPADAPLPVTAARPYGWGAVRVS